MSNHTENNFLNTFQNNLLGKISPLDFKYDSQIID